MLFGIGLPQRAGLDLRSDLVGLAAGAEEEGFASLWVYERLLFPVTPVDGLYGVEGLPWIEAYQQAADSLTVLAAAAATTERIRLGTSVLVASLHEPLRLAKALATVDHISGGGRLLAGLGSGWSRDERRAVGAAGHRPGTLLDETLDVLAKAWGPDPVVCHGPRGEVNGALVRPKPLKPIPVLLGGGQGARALERIATRAQGWMAVAVPVAAAADAWRGITARAADLGRDPEDMRFVYRANVVLLDQPIPEETRFPFVGSIDQICADAAQAAAVGVDELILELQLQENFPGSAREMLNLATTIRYRTENETT